MFKEKVCDDFMRRRRRGNKVGCSPDFDWDNEGKVKELSENYAKENNLNEEQFYQQINEKANIKAQSPASASASEPESVRCRRDGSCSLKDDSFIKLEGEEKVKHLTNIMNKANKELENLGAAKRWTLREVTEMWDRGFQGPPYLQSDDFVRRGITANEERRLIKETRDVLKKVHINPPEGSMEYNNIIYRNVEGTRYTPEKMAEYHISQMKIDDITDYLRGSKQMRAGVGSLLRKCGLEGHLVNQIEFLTMVNRV
eukprot:Pgem_evm1s5666